MSLRQLGDDDADPAEQLASAGGRRRIVALPPGGSKRELEVLELRGERLEAQRPGRAAQAVRFVRRFRDRRRPLGGKPSPVERVELELDPLETPGGVEQKEGDQVA